MCHALTRAVEVKVFWDPEVEYWVAVDNKTTMAGEGDTAHEALSAYLEDWTLRIGRLTEDEAQLGKHLLTELRSLQRLLGIPRRNAD